MINYVNIFINYNYLCFFICWVRKNCIDLKEKIVYIVFLFGI